jgi:hypothetical protein
MAKCGRMCFRTKVFVKITTYLKVELQDYCCGQSHFRIHGLGLMKILGSKDVHCGSTILTMYMSTFEQV